MQGIQRKWLEERGINIDKYKDPYQADYVDKLFDESVEAIFGIGKAGTGKTTLAAMVGIYLVEKQEYSKLIYIRSPHTVGQGLGFLEGGLSSKQAPYMKPFLECLELAKINGDAWVKFNKLIMTTPTYERGVNFDDAFVICDEFQSWELIEAKTILTRKKDNCKIIMTGSLNQNDNPRNKIKGKTPFEWYMDHFRSDFPKVQICPLVTSYRGWFSQKADEIDETIEVG